MRLKPRISSTAHLQNSVCIARMWTNSGQEILANGNPLTSWEKNWPLLLTGNASGFLSKNSPRHDGHRIIWKMRIVFIRARILFSIRLSLRMMPFHLERHHAGNGWFPVNWQHASLRMCSTVLLFSDTGRQPCNG